MWEFHCFGGNFRGNLVIQNSPKYQYFWEFHKIIESFGSSYFLTKNKSLPSCRRRRRYARDLHLDVHVPYLLFSSSCCLLYYLSGLALSLTLLLKVICSRLLNGALLRPLSVLTRRNGHLRLQCLFPLKLSSETRFVKASFKKSIEERFSRMCFSALGQQQKKDSLTSANKSKLKLKNP